MKYLKKVILVLICALALCNATILNAQVWYQEANFGGTARLGAYSFSIGNIGYIGGGETSSNLSDMWSYNPATNSWTQEASFSNTRSLSTSFAIDTLGYVCCGYNGGYYGDLWAYSPATNSWTVQTPLTSTGAVPRYAPASFVINGQAYVGTGVHGGTLNDFYQYTPGPSGGTWVAVANFPGLARYSASGFAIGSEGYVGLGQSISQNVDFYQYDPASNTWAQMANFPAEARNYVTSFSIGNEGYFCCGNGTSSESLVDCWKWNATTNTWTQIANFGGGPRWIAATFTIGYNAYVGTGQYRDSNKYKNDLWKYNPCAPGQPAAIFGSASICDGSTQTYSIASVENAASYTWTLPNGWTGNSTDTFITVVAGSTGGTISVTADDSCGSSPAQTMNVVVNANPSPSIIPNGPTTFCDGGSVNLDAGTWSAYSWSDLTMSENDLITAGGNYMVTVTDFNGCTGMASQSVTVNSLPIVGSIISPSSTVCYGTNVTLNGTGAVIYSWSDSIIDGTPFMAVASNLYTVIGTDSNGCTGMASQMVTVNSLPNVGSTALPSSTVCYGTNVTLNGTGAINYIWNNNVADGVPFMAVASNTYNVIGIDSDRKSTRLNSS